MALTLRDNFSLKTKSTLAARVNHKCFNPACAVPTSGPAAQPNRAVNIGVAAHITAASPGGPRFNLLLSNDERSAIENAIWLCATCAKRIDDDVERYSEEVLGKWVVHSESAALSALEDSHERNVDSLSAEAPPASGKDWFAALADAFNKIRGARHVAVSSLPARFLSIFEHHGIHRNQIPRFFGHGLTPKDLASESAVLEALTEEMLANVCVMFAVRREWLDGAESQLHECHDFYQYPAAFHEFIAGLKAASTLAPLVALVIAPSTADGDDEAVLIIAEPLSLIGDKLIFRYHLCHNWMFRYWKSRAYFTACIATAWRLGFVVQGRTSDNIGTEALRHGEAPLGPKFNRYYGSYSGKWHTDDLALEPTAYLNRMDAETNNYGHRMALELWLELDTNGFMDLGNGLRPRPKFEQALEAVCRFR